VLIQLHSSGPWGGPDTGSWRRTGGYSPSFLFPSLGPFSLYPMLVLKEIWTQQGWKEGGAEN
jgi:hypothetical protein